MRVDRKTVLANRAAILDQAGKLFRERGIEDVAVADITRAVGLTHGGFYNHFPSKAALAAQACTHSLALAAERWRERAAAAKRAGHDPIATLIDSYLNVESRDTPAASCMLACLGAEATRNRDLLPAMAEGADALAAVLQGLIAERRPDLAPKAQSQAALAVLAAMSGGLNLARLLAADPERSAAALAGAAALAKRAAE